MSRAKGTPKTGGRQAGTPNKITGSLKDFITDLLNDNREQIQDDLKVLRPKERIAAYLSMMQYVLPKQQAVSADVDLNDLSKDLKITCIYKSPDDDIFPSSEAEVDLERD
jgi:hypothetical protein